MTLPHPIELAVAQRLVETWARRSFWRRRGFAARLECVGGQCAISVDRL